MPRHLPQALIQRAQSLTRQFPAAGNLTLAADVGTQATSVQNAILPEAIALALFALVLALAALLIAGQAATRLLATGSPDNPALAALGVTRRQLIAAGLIKVGGGHRHRCGGGCRAAVAAPPLMPIGAARLTEPDQAGRDSGHLRRRSYAATRRRRLAEGCVAFLHHVLVGCAI